MIEVQIIHASSSERKEVLEYDPLEDAHHLRVLQLYLDVLSWVLLSGSPERSDQTREHLLGRGTDKWDRRQSQEGYALSPRPSSRMWHARLKLTPIYQILDAVWPGGESSIKVLPKGAISEARPKWLNTSSFAGIVVGRGNLEIRSFSTGEREGCSVTMLLRTPNR